MNRDINKSIKFAMKFAIISSICFIIGIPLIPVFAGKIWTLMIVGILLTVFGFYGSVLMWVHFYRLVVCRDILFQIEENDLRDVKDIARTISVPKVFARISTKYLVAKRYVVGYRLNEYDILEKISKKDKKLSQNKCPNCGANLKLKNQDIHTCKYCGAELSRK